MPNEHRTLSACVVVRNAERELPSMSERLLDALSDLRTRFELVVVDAGSRDGSREAIESLTVRYPQIRAIGLSQPLGYKAALRQGISRATGEMLLFSERATWIPASALNSAWQSSAETAAVFFRAKRPAMIDRLSMRESGSDEAGLMFGHYRSEADGNGHAAERGGEPREGFQLVRRDVLKALRWLPLERVELMVAMAERGYDWAELEFDPRHASKMRRTSGEPIPAAHHGGARRPNYMDRLKRFALGE